MEKEKRILILAGGGGHTGFAYALAQRLKDNASLLFLIPEGDKLSYERLSGFGNVDYIPKPRGAKTPTSEFAYNLARAFAVSLKKVTRNFDVVVSTGSNFCIPPAFAALLKKIQIINIEGEVRFTRASLTARILQPFSAITALQWPEQKKLLKGTVVGPLFHRPEIKPWNGGYILVTGGTLGHKQLFDAVNESNLKNIVLQTGKISPEPYRKRHPEWKIMRYSSKFPELLAGAELIVTHFGSTALESVVYQKPAVMVLNPEWTRTVGKTDAKVFAKKVGATFLSDITLESLLDAIEEAKNNKIPALKDGAEVLAEMILNL
ncbi:MAG TPA: polysaccharide biosynthesis protein [Candidatus Bathyarchaeota archaeon]|nr:polysaccharide biosynthesis protein [Candidatus Bathyarchaeota archaeon]